MAREIENEKVNAKILNICPFTFAFRCIDQTVTWSPKKWSQCMHLPKNFLMSSSSGLTIAHWQRASLAGFSVEPQWETMYMTMAEDLRGYEQSTDQHYCRVYGASWAPYFLQNTEIVITSLCNPCFFFSALPPLSPLLPAFQMHQLLCVSLLLYMAFLLWNAFN